MVACRELLEPTIQAQSIFLKKVFFLTRTLANALDAVELVQDSLRYQGQVNEAIEEERRARLEIRCPNGSALKLSGSLKESRLEMSFASRGIFKKAADFGLVKRLFFGGNRKRDGAQVLPYT